MSLFPNNTDIHDSWMIQAIEFAEQGRGRVEPNPMVGCVVVKNGVRINQGFHQRFGESHAEVNALSGLEASEITGSTIYVTLEPCAHFGKTPPCVDLLIKSRPRLIVVGLEDPFPEVSGRSIRLLREAGIEVLLDVQREACTRLVAPYLKRLEIGLPWIIAKWAMTLDGRLATHSGDSKWVTSDVARQHAHRVRSNVDGILVGIGTLLSDDPMLTARPLGSDAIKGHRYSVPGDRIPIRMVMDRAVRTPLDSQLVRSSGTYRTVIACGPDANKMRIKLLQSSGCEVVVCSNDHLPTMIRELTKPLVQSGMTNLLVDGGPRLIGAFMDHQMVDEVHVYIAPKVVGGAPTVVPNRGEGVPTMDLARKFTVGRWEILGEDLFFTGLCDNLKGT